MSILIKGMEIPESCYTCQCADIEYFDCNLMPGTRIERYKRLDNCPLIPVPPHGRLIDADALGTPGTIEEDTLWRGRIETEVYLASTIYNAPTIIPAEEG